MRYIVTEQIRDIVWNNRKLLRYSDFPHNQNNWLYKNKSISENHLNGLCDFLKINKEKIKLIKFEFPYEKNFGTYSTPIEFTFNGPDEVFSEIIGIMLGDGSLSKNRISITMDSREKQYKDHIISLFSDTFGIKLRLYYPNKDRNCVRLYTYGKKLVELFLRYGLKEGNKIKNNVGIPSWIFQKKSFMISCTRGLIDTDGYLHYHKRDKQIVVGFTNLSNNMVNDFIQMTKILGFNFTRHKKDIRLFKKDKVKSFLDLIKLSNDRHLNKYNNFLRNKGLSASLV